MDQRRPTDGLTDQLTDKTSRVAYPQLKIGAERERERKLRQGTNPESKNFVSAIKRKRRKRSKLKTKTVKMTEKRHGKRKKDRMSFTIRQPTGEGGENE